MPRFTLLLFTAFLATGCFQSSPSRELPEAFHEHLTSGAVDPTELREWCEGYWPDRLQVLTRRALTNNRELAAARANLRAAEASARAAGATRIPSLDLEGSVRRSRQPFFADVEEDVPVDFETTVTRYRAGVAAQYEVDFWGRLGDEREAAALEATASEEDLRTARITLTAEVAERWFELLAQRQTSELLTAEVAASERTLELVRLRFTQGQTQGLDVVQQRQQTEALNGQQILTQVEMPVLARELGVLLGEPPDPATRPGADGDLPMPTPLPLAGIPANLLQLRPDLRAAGTRMAAADRQAAAALAARLPAVVLSAQLFGETENITDLFETLFFDLLGSFNLVLLDGGRLRAEVDVADAQADAALAEYAQTLLTALAEVGNALALEQSQRRYLASLGVQRDEAERAWRLAREGYVQGALDYLRVLGTQQTLFETERALIDGRRQLLSFRLQACRALGHAPGA